MRLWSRLRLLNSTLLLLVLCCASGQLPSLAATQLVSATVDFSVSTPKKNMSGFLHGLGNTYPSDAQLLPLKPAWWRVRAGDGMHYQRAVNVGSRVQVVLSDGYGYPQENWKGRGAPWENNWLPWENFVREMAQQYRGTNVYWDVWNEPDIQEWNKTQFWNGTQLQFFETYKRAYTILRQELGPNAIIGGPSYANYTPKELTAFLTYCNQNALQVNFLSWHELMSAELAIPSISQHIIGMWNLANTYPNLKVQQIFINESVGPKSQYLPGDILGFLYYMELGGADGSNKACWPDSRGRNNCFNQSLDGIIDPELRKPRAAWWTYKTYADGITSRVQAASNNANLVVMASKTPRQILVGFLGTATSGTAKVTLNLRNLGAIGQNTTKMQITLVKIPSAKEAAVTRLAPVGSAQVAVKNGSATLTLPAINLHEQYVIYLGPVDSRLTQI